MSDKKNKKRKDPLFPDFLEDEEQYHEAQDFWKEEIDEWSDAYDFPVETNYQTDENDYEDGNPIFDAYFPAHGKSLRVNQYDPEDEEAPEFDVSFDETELEGIDDSIDEMTIDLILSKENARRTRHLLRHWTEADMDPQQMEKWMEEEE